MRINFHGAAHTVTGSQHLLEINGCVCGKDWSVETVVHQVRQVPTMINVRVRE